MAWTTRTPVVTVPALALLALACSHELEGPAPTLQTIMPNTVCTVQRASTLKANGDGFSPMAEESLTSEPILALPTITLRRTAALSGGAVSGNPIVIPDDPRNPSASRVKWTSQKLMTFDVYPELNLETGIYTVEVTNPNGQTGSAAAALTIVPPPTVTGVQPAVICAGGGDLVIIGMDFSATPKVLVGNVEATVRTAMSTRIEVTVGPIEPGLHDITVDNQNGCSDTLEDALRVTPGPSVYFVDPPTTYSGISVQATIYVTGLINAPTAVSIRASGAASPTPLTGVTYDPVHPNRVLAVVPAQLTAGDYDVIVSDGQCQATLPAGLHVESNVTVAVDDVTPPFGWRLDDTAVTITATDPAPSGEKQFQATPRAYLSPRAGGAQLARPLQAVAFATATRLTAVVGDGLAAGSYDLIIVNPDRSVGVLENAYLVTADAAPPPIVDTLTPGSVVSLAGQQVTFLGRNFRSPTVVATCALDAGGMQEVTGTSVSGAGTSITATFNMNGLARSVCVVRVTNSDTTYVDFSALTVTEPSRNVPPTVADESMATPRRALAAAAGRVTSQSRYLYAIGGDDGTDGGVLTSIEAAPVTLFGALDPFFTLPTSLPAGRSMAGVTVIGRFIYLVGGRLAAGPTTSVVRAQILDPRAAPDVNDLDIAPGEGAGLDPGLVYYRVSAVMAAGDPSNPGGETAASDPFGVVVPPLPGKAKLTVIWSAVPGAASYRIYRTPMAGDLVGTARLVGTSTMARFTDTGLATQSAAPLPEGALGTWREVGPLPTAREGAGVAFAADPDTAGRYYLYAIGGRNATTAALATYTYASVVIAEDGSQTVGTFSPDAAFLGTARWQLGAIAMDNARASLVPAGDSWVYALSGFGTTGMFVSQGTAGKVGSDGALTSIKEVSGPNNIAGYGVAGANNQIYTFGGAGGGGDEPQTDAKSGTMMMPVPDVGNFNDLGFGLTQARHLPGSALESAFIFIVGGRTGTSAATATTERTHW